MRVFDYIFYRIAFFYKRKKDLSPETTASLIVSLLQFFFILDLFIIVRVFYEYSIPSGFNKAWPLPFIIVLGLINWYVYEKNSRYQEFRKIWKDEDEHLRKKRGVWIVLFLTIVILVPVLYGLVRQNIMTGRSFFS
jgi:hypothetical protein